MATRRTRQQTKRSAKSQPVEESQNLFQCGLCSMTFSTNKELVDHVKALSCIKPYQCGYCQVSYHANTKLLSHVKVHKLFLFVPVGNVSVPKSDNVGTGAGPGFEVCEGNSTISSSCEMNTDSRGTKSVSHSEHLTSSGDGRVGLSSDAGGNQQDTSTDGGEDLNTVEDEEQGNGIKTEQNEDDFAMLPEPAAGPCKEEDSCLETSAQSPGESDSGNAELSSNTEQTEACSGGQPKNHTSPHTSRGRRVVQDSAVFQCGECDAVFKGQAILSAHWKSHHSACNFCEETFSDPRDRHKHCVTEHDTDTVPDKPFLCALCGAKFPVSRYVLDHIRSIHKMKIKRQPALSTQAGPELFQCGECGSGFKSMHCLSEHWQSQHGTCTDCDVSFTDPQELYQHFISSHSVAGVSGKPFWCAICGTKYPVARYVTDHIRRMHRRQKNSSQPVSNVQASEESKGGALIANSVPTTESGSGKFAGLDSSRTMQAQSGLIGDNANPSSCSLPQGIIDQHKEFGFRCAECHAVFNSEHTISDHWKAQHSACTVCGEFFPSPGDRQQHFVTKHGVDTVSDRPFMCAVCGAMFAVADYVKNHIQQIHGQEINPGSHTGLAVKGAENDFASAKTNLEYENLLISNILDVNGSTDPKARQEDQLCLFEQAEQGSTELKIPSDQTEYGHQCGECGMCFKSAPSLSDHWQANHQSCSVCGASFYDPHELYEHFEASHSKGRVSERPFVCAICGMRSAVAKSLSTHMQQRHRQGKRLSRASASDSDNGSRASKHSKGAAADMSHEVKIHDNEDEDSLIAQLRLKQQGRKSGLARDKSRICPICGKRVKNVKGHMLVHSEERPYACTLCNKSYKSSMMLDVHMKTHTKERPYMCDVCGQSFALQTTLSYHANRHTNARPYKCEICGKGFNSHPGMRRHVLTHTGEKRYTCDVCGKKFISSSALKTHALTHTDLRPFSCNTCGKTFRSRGTRRYHMLHSHNSR